MNEYKKGWIKKYRVDLNLLKELTDQEYRFWETCLLLVDWEPRHKAAFGTFDARIETLKDYLPWSSGKISEIKNSLIGKEYYIKAKEHKLRIKNPAHHFGRSRDIEGQIYSCEGDFHRNEGVFQRTEVQREALLKDIKDLGRNMNAPWNRPSKYRKPEEPKKDKET